MNIMKPDRTLKVLLLKRTNQREKQLRGFLSRIGDNKRSWEIIIASNASEVEDLDSGSFAALILYDWMIEPKTENILVQVRKRHALLPVLVVGSGSDEEIRIAAFEAGADNYVHADFSDQEMLAKLNRLIVRSEAGAPSIQFQGLQVWPNSQIAFRDGSPIKLSLTEMALLKCLAEFSPRPVDRKTLLSRVFQLNFDPGTNIVEVHVHRLRQKIDKGYAENLVNTVRGRGYMLGKPSSVDDIRPAKLQNGYSASSERRGRNFLSS
jgi:two-component system copper resistance phosphate regulon response regulator CusR